MANIVLKPAKRTDLGKTRKENQDYVGVDRELKVFVLCDGAGGHEDGKMASKTAAETVIQEIKTSVQALSANLSRRDKLAAYEKIVRHSIQSSSKAVALAAEKLGHKNGSYSTLDLIWFVDGSTAILGHVGDGLMFRENGKIFTPLTVDHNNGTDLNRTKEKGDSPYTRTQIRKSATLRQLSKAIGLLAVDPDVSTVSLAEGDRFVICSDGLIDAVSPDDIAKIVSSATDSESAASQLLAKALSGEAKDNISFWLIECQPALAEEEKTRVFSPSHLSGVLSSMLPFRRLSPQEREAFMGKCQRVVKKDGEVLMTEGEPADVLWIILDGTVKVLRGEHEVNKHNGPIPIGEGAFSDEPFRRTATVKAAGQVRALTISDEDFERFAVHYPRAAYLICRGTNKMLVDKTESLSRNFAKLKTWVTRLKANFDQALPSMDEP